MGWRRILIYYSLAAVVGGSLYVEHRLRTPRIHAEITQPPIVQFLASRIDRLRLSGRGVDLRFARSEGRWTVVEPAGIEVGSDLVDALLDTLTTIPPVELLRDQSEDLVQFGLSPPQFSLEFESEEQPVATVEIGRRNPTRTAIYARLNDEGPVYLLGFNAQYYVELIVDAVADQERPETMGDTRTTTK